ncbi:MAG: hypothetical protein A2279_00790 [Stygiobacter sp. RIFOXYA12_FULL_38_9]|nr:MAG: hypothetical protein A2279_00790 [Stygiobacter sp. RIFOXYA12_FULL_38_9]
MEILNLFSLFTERLSAHKIEYIVTGSVASIVYGEPRLTHDIDLVLVLKENKVEELVSAFPVDLFYCPPKEIIINELKRSSRGHINLIHHETGFKADIYFVGQDDLQAWAIRNRKTIDLLGKELFIAPPEYVIVKKMEFFKEGHSQKHLTDIAGMLKHSGALINLDIINDFAAKFNLEEVWERARKISTD